MEQKTKTGPLTSQKEFFGVHLNTDIPELAPIKECLKKEDYAGAQKIFASYVRGFLQPNKLISFWKDKEYSEREKERLTNAVNNIYEYKFVSCGVPYQFKDGKVDWEFNPTYNAYKEWPWQLSRHPELSRLAEYYCLTGDEKASAMYVELITSWIRQAVLETELNGYSTVCWRTIEAGIRMSGWSHQIHAFINSPNVTDEFLTMYFTSVWEHGWRLRKFCNHGNWLLMEMHGLLRISLLYPFFRDEAEWKEYALKRLEAEFEVQIYPDGFQYELSTGYHGVVDSNYSSIYDIYKSMDIPAPDFFETKLVKLYEMYPRLVRPDGRLPDLNDGTRMDIRGKMAKAYSLYPDRSDFLWAKSDGKEGTEPDYLSYAFPYSGSVAMRTDWSKDAVWGYMDCSPFGRGHQHEDKLNVLVFAYGKPFIEEGGNYDYDSSDMRRYVLSTRAHNTVRFNGWDQNRRKNYKWNDEDINKKADFLFNTTDIYDVAESQYDEGYGPNLHKIVHKRKLIFLKQQEGTTPFFVVIDRFIAPDNEKTTYEEMWHLESCEFSLENHLAEGDFGDGLGITIAFSDTDAEIKNAQGQYQPVYQGWMPIKPVGPHEHRPVPTPICYGSFEGSHRTVTVLYPYKDGENIVKGVSASSDISDTKFEITFKDGKTVIFDETDFPF